MAYMAVACVQNRYRQCSIAGRYGMLAGGSGG